MRLQLYFLVAILQLSVSEEISKQDLTLGEKHSEIPSILPNSLTDGSPPSRDLIMVSGSGHERNNLPRRKGKRKPLKERFKNAKQNIWWPWRSYEEWRMSRNGPQNNTTDTLNKPKFHKRKQAKLLKDRKIKVKGRRKGKKKNFGGGRRKMKNSQHKVDVNKTSNVNSTAPDNLEDDHVLSVRFYSTADEHQRTSVKPTITTLRPIQLMTSEKPVPASLKPNYDVDNNVKIFQQKLPTFKTKYARETRKNFTSDHNECLKNNGGCEGLCINTPGSFRCHCPEGFRVDPFTKKCTDINECLVRNGHGPCQGECYNNWGSFHCGCQSVTGTKLAEDGKSCVVVDACSKEECSHLCINTRSGAFCACPQGFTLAVDWKTCVDVDECTQPELQDPKCTGGCVNLDGSYKCL